MEAPIDWEQLRRDLAAATPGGWSTGHLCRDDHACNCRYIFGGDDKMGAVASVYVDDGENQDPPLEEAKANQRLIALAPDLASLVLAAHDAAEGRP